MKKKILITGGAGFIGSHTTRALLHKQYSVVCVDNFDPFYSLSVKQKNISDFLKNPHYKLYKEDIRNYKNLEKIFLREKPDRIIHLAAKAGVRPSIEKPGEYQEVNVAGTLNLLELARKYKIKQFIFASSSSVYGNNKQIPFSENDNTDEQISPYGATKKAGELLCRTYSHLYKIPVTCLRFFTVYGPSGRPDMAPYKFTENIYKGIPLTKYGEGNSRRDYTFIDDIVTGIVSCLSKKLDFEIFNLGGGSMISLNKFVALIEKIVGKKAKIKRMSNQMGDVKVTNADISKAKKILKFNPKYDIEKGMKNFFEWYLQNGK